MISLQCVEAFSPIAVCFGGEQNREGYGPQSGQYLHSWGGSLHLLYTSLLKCALSMFEGFFFSNGGEGEFYLI